MSIFFPNKKDADKESVRVHMNDQLAIDQISRGLDNFLDSLSTCSRNQEIVFVCIGTDRSTGDCLGPLIGSQLIERNRLNCPIYGTLDSPVHAGNLADYLETITQKHSKPLIIAIDACLGKLESVGYISIKKGSLKPGAGVNKNLPPVGDVHITGIVNVGGFMEYFVLQNTRLSVVMKMASVICRAIERAFLKQKNTRSQ